MGERMLKVKRLVVILCSMCLMLLAAGCSGAPLNVTISCDGEVDELGDAYFTIQTNLPDETNLIVGIKGINDSGLANDNYSAQEKVTVKNGNAVAGPFRNESVPLPAGEYNVEITMPYAGVQPENVQRVIGKKGKNLRGDDIVVSSEDEGEYIEYNLPWEMVDFAESLSEREHLLCLATFCDVVINKRSMELEKHPSALRYTEFYFSRVVMDASVMKYLQQDDFLSEFLLAAVDYNAKGYYPDTKKSFEQQESGAYLQYMKFSDNDKWVSVITNDYFELVKSTRFDESAIEKGDAYMYTAEELQHVNLALNQLIGWLELEFSSVEDFQAFTANNN